MLNHTDGGHLNKLNSITFLLIFIFNSATYILEDKSLLDNWSNTLIFGGASIVAYFIKNKYLLGLMDLALGIVMVNSPDYYSDTSGLVFFFFAYKQLQIKRKPYYIFAILLICLALRLQLLQEDPISTFTMILVFSYITAKYILMYHSFKISTTKISEKDKAILKLYSKGYEYSEIGETLGINDKKDSMRTAITRARKISGCKNDIQFGIWLSEIG